MGLDENLTLETRPQLAPLQKMTSAAPSTWKTALLALSLAAGLSASGFHPVAETGLNQAAGASGDTRPTPFDAESRGQTACAARPTRVADRPLTWHHAPADDRADVDRWCLAVGPPVLVPAPNSTDHRAPALENLVVLTWNTHLAEGRLTALITDLRAGRLTGGQPVTHFVLLLQELYRRGEDVPEFAPAARAAFAITARDPRAPDARDYAQALGLSLFYLPSMRNGAAVREDRGNAVVSSEPLTDLFAMELPFERQRRVVAGASVWVRTERGLDPLRVVDAHLEPLSSPASLWLFRNPRRRQMAALLTLLGGESHRGAGTVLGGDFNTIQGGIEDDAYVQARAWSSSLRDENTRSTHYMGRLDFVFARLGARWTMRTQRIGEKYGSDHHPVLARFAYGGPATHGR